jgi:acyl-CoA synthetase (NDP forming)
VDPDAVAAAIRRGADAAPEATGPKKCVLACFMTGGGFPAALGGGVDAATRPIPTFRFPEPAARALARAVAYATWRRQPPGTVLTPAGVDAAAARRVVEQALAAHGDGWLRPDAVAGLLRAAGMPLPPFALAATPAAAAAAATAIGLPVAVKIDAPTITHKSDVGGVVLDLPSPGAVQAACEQMLARLGPNTPVNGFLVQQMVERGVEVMAGVVDDPVFGPLAGFGMGGTAVEVLNDMAFRITPLSDADVAAMVRSIRGLPLLRGHRGRPPADIAAIEDLLLRISWLVEEVPAIAEMDLNPVMVRPEGKGLVVVDARVRVRA